MTKRRKIPKRVSERLNLAIYARGVSSSQIYHALGWSSAKLANYRGGRAPRAEEAIALGRIIGFNTLWLSEGNLEGVTNLKLRAKIEQLIDDGWVDDYKDVRQGKRGRPQKHKQNNT